MIVNDINKYLQILTLIVACNTQSNYYNIYYTIML